MTGQQKYTALSAFLGKQTTDKFVISIAELEKIIGFPLPPSAKVHPAWWSNQNPPISQTKAWASVGWNAFPNLKTRAITFSRKDPSRGSKIAPPSQIREKLLLPEFQLQEEEIKNLLRIYLEGDGWKAAIVEGGAHGIDIDATRGDERWIIEVKGCGSLNPMRVNYFLAALGELLQRMSDPRAKYSVAFPDLPQFRGLWQRLPGLAKERTGVTCLLVRADGYLTEVR